MKLLLHETDQGGVGNALARNFLEYGHEVYAHPGTDYIERIGGKSVRDQGMRNIDFDLLIFCHVGQAHSGYIDALRQSEMRVIGASREVAHLERSKAFGVAEFRSMGYEMPDSYSFNSIDDAIDFVCLQREPFVVKVDDSSDPMGVVMPKAWMDTLWVLRNERTVKNKPVVLQRVLKGCEVGFGGFFDGKRVDLMSVLFEHKRVFAGDQGPNCAEMGSSVFPADELDRQGLSDLIFSPLIPFLQRSGFRGFIDLNGIIGEDLQWRLLEVTSRFGSPQWEILIWQVDDDLGTYLYNLASDIEQGPLRLKPGYAVGVTMVAGGYPYPNACRLGSPVYGDLENAHGVTPMAVKWDETNGVYRTAGGRIVTVTGLGRTMIAAQIAAYEKIKRIQFLDHYYRLDIGDHGRPGKYEEYQLFLDWLEKMGVYERER